MTAAVNSDSLAKNVLLQQHGKKMHETSVEPAKNYRNKREKLYFMSSLGNRIISSKTISKTKFKRNETKTAQLNLFGNKCAPTRVAGRERRKMHTKFVNCCRRVFPL